MDGEYSRKGFDRHGRLKDQFYGHGGALTQLTFGLNSAALQFDQFLRQRQADARSFVKSGSRSIALEEAVKHAGERFRTNSVTRVSDRQLQLKDLTDRIH